VRMANPSASLGTSRLSLLDQTGPIGKPISRSRSEPAGRRCKPSWLPLGNWTSPGRMGRPAISRLPINRELALPESPNRPGKNLPPRWGLSLTSEALSTPIAPTVRSGRSFALELTIVAV
jgi:hypothetical protein